MCPQQKVRGDRVNSCLLSTTLTKVNWVLTWLRVKWQYFIIWVVNTDTITFCRNCSTKIIGPAEKCYMCRSDPLSGNAYCPGCGCPTPYPVRNCLKCGTPLSYNPPKTSIVNPKSKAISILLALSLGLFTWLYTYKQDAGKFWLGLGLSVLGLIVFSVTFRLSFGNSHTFGVPANSNANWLLPMMISFSVVSGLWAWSFLDVIRKTNNWYAQYPNHN